MQLCITALSMFAHNLWMSCLHSDISYEPADLTVHAPRTAEGGFIFFRIGV